MHCGHRFKDLLVGSVFMVLVVAGIGFSGCTPKASTKSPLMEQYPNIDIASSELRTLNYEWAHLNSNMIAALSDSILQLSEDQRLRKNVLYWRIYAVNATYRAAFQSDPMASLIDMVVLSRQTINFFESGIGSTEFGDFAAPILTRSKKSEAFVIEIARRAATDDSLLLTKGVPAFQAWADEHPITNVFFLRLSTRPLISEFAHAEYKGGLAGISEMNETLADLTNRLEAYMETASKQFRWQSAIILEDLELNKHIPQLVADVNRIYAAADSVADGIYGVIDLVPYERNLILAAVDEKVEIALAAVDSAMVLAFAQVALEREIVLTEVGAIKDETIRQVDETADQLIDRVFWRALQLAVGILIGVLVVGAALILLARRTGRSGPQAA